MIKRFLGVTLLIVSSIVSAQRNNASPYSFFGIGFDSSPKTIEQNSMGDIGVAMKQNNYLNFSNPAAYADLRVATYALGAQTSFLKLEDNVASQSGNLTTFRYIALGFPIGKKSGLSAGLKPANSVGYIFINNNFDSDNNLTETTKYSGEGGTTKIFATFGTYLYKGLSLGLEGNYVFGSLNNDIEFQKSDVLLGTKYNNETNLKGFEFKAGAQYQTKLSEKLQLSTGVTVKLPNKLKRKGTESLYSLSLSSGVQIPRDTLYLRSVNTEIENPTEFSVGAGIGNQNKWYVGVNTTFKGELKIKGDELQNSYRYEKAFKTSLGGYYIPKINSISSYWDRITYRAGFRFEKTGLLVNPDYTTNNNFESVQDFGINLGLGLPLPKQLSNVNVGFEYGQRGTSNNNLIKESYYNVRLGLSLNSLNWFKKRQID